MDFVFKFIFLFLLGTKLTPTLGGITRNQDGSIEFSAGNSYMKIGPKNALIIRDGRASLERNCNGSVKMSAGNSQFSMQDSGKSLEIKDGSTLIKKSPNGLLQLADGKTNLVADTTKQTAEMIDGNSSLKKNSQYSMLVDGRSSIVNRKDKSLEIIDGRTSLKKDSKGAVQMVDGNTILSVSDAGATLKMADGRSSIEKMAKNNRVELKDGSTSHVKDSTGFMELKDGSCSIIRTVQGALVLSKGKSKITKRPQGSIRADDEKTAFAHSRLGVHIQLRISKDEMEDLIVKIENRKLIVEGIEETKNGKGWRDYTITTPLPSTLTEEQITVCYAPEDNFLEFLVPIPGQKMDCPKTTMEPQSLKQFRKSLPLHA